MVALTFVRPSAPTKTAEQLTQEKGQMLMENIKEIKTSFKSTEPTENCFVRHKADFNFKLQAFNKGDFYDQYKLM